MSRNRRILREMAGIVATPFERLQKRELRRMERLNRDVQRDLALLDQIGRREKGDDKSLKPMPFARQETNE